ncbi:hypothetical protein [Streptomyces sp. WAC06614]|uniref:hypothetical protein n=1 Tax=Streptomyces sp. WAC06614 TaxID=2487416 RepID=UPI000F775F84|nr:hypothetical protein [Streptomyces sp. WAC06614]RSS84074.1 hypothetical protein EF918_01800 [Streptomyces sp. WAC06614]
MSTPPPPSQPPHAPGPYAPHQTGRPHPYGAQPHGGPQPYAAYPPQQQPYPAPTGWGPPPMGPPQRNRTGLVVGIVAAVAAGLLAAGFVVANLGGSGSGSGGATGPADSTASDFPEAKYRLTVPKTLLGGTYALDQDLSQTKGKEALDGAYDPKIRDPKPAVGQYSSTSPTEKGALVISGMYGRFKDPAGARQKMLAGAAQSDGATVAVPPKDITPAGAEVTVSCQVLTTTEQGVKVTLPMCAWADGNTGASVAMVTEKTSRQSPTTIDLDAMATTTLKVRTETRQPLG